MQFDNIFNKYLFAAQDISWLEVFASLCHIERLLYNIIFNAWIRRTWF